METISFNDKVFKRYNDHYYVSADGEVYSTYMNRCLKPGLDADGYLRVDINGKHVKLHKLVFLTWVGPIDELCQINHKDDNKHNNHWSNLYQGTQKENISDCIRNNHRIGHTYYMTVYDKVTGKTLVFCPAINFAKFSGHSCTNGGVSRMVIRNWFKSQYVLIEYEQIKDIDHLESLTTMGDECNPVGRSLSPVEAHGIDITIDEEIV